MDVEQLIEDLEDIAASPSNRFLQAEAAERLCFPLIQQHGDRSIVPVSKALCDWWTELHEPHGGHGGEADKHTLLALLESIRSRAAMGS